MIHELKVQPRFFVPMQNGKKNFEIRKKDREYKVGDILILREWNDIMQNYSGQTIKRRITYIYNGCGQFGLAPNYVVLGLKEVE